MGEARERQRLQPHPSGAGERGQEDAVPAEELVPDALDRGDAEAHRLLEEADVTRVDTQRLAGDEVVDDDLSTQLDPGASLPVDRLEAEAVAAEDPRPEALLEAERELDAVGAGDEGVAVGTEARPGLGGDVDGEDLPRQPGQGQDSLQLAVGRLVGVAQDLVGV